MLKIFNTESRKKEEIRPIDGKIKMYTCGPTVYDFAHIGNFRTYVFEDLLRRTIQFFGMEIEQVMNLTDIDDKTLKGALEKDVSIFEFTEPYKKAFFEDLKTLKIQPAEHYPQATDFIPEMIEMIETLIEKGYAYISKNKSVYFSISHFSSYGRLSHLNLEDLKVNASGDNDADEYEKENLSDFVLWKAYDPTRDGKVFWESPFGKGRPGWHIECSAMAKKFLGDTIDIHCGGVDNMFPHHENEIAQSECCNDAHFVRHWVHAEHLLVGHKKMSKSLGNFYTLRDLLNQGYQSDEIRFCLLSTHYRTQLNFTMDGLTAARSSLKRIEDLIYRLQAVHEEKPATVALERFDLSFKKALADDLNISLALASLFDLIKELNIAMDGEKLGTQDAKKALELFKNWDKVLDIIPKIQDQEIPKELFDLLEKREQARREKNWKLSDEMRDAISSKGFVIEDTPQGARLKKK